MKSGFLPGVFPICRDKSKFPQEWGIKGVEKKIDK